MIKNIHENLDKIDYKNREFLRRFVTSQFKITPSRRTKLPAKIQRKIAQAIKNARFMALLPYTRNQAVKK